jgi:hypothetical protein
MSYDSTPDTLSHIINVQALITRMISMLNSRSIRHDHSKLITPEKEVFDIYTPKLRDTTYGSEEYFEYLIEMQKALNHHYEQNRHHPEHFEDGINEMNLIDLMEMLCDWIAATKRHADGDIIQSIELNQKRFQYGDQLKQILLNTVIMLTKE